MKAQGGSAPQVCTKMLPKGAGSEKVVSLVLRLLTSHTEAPGFEPWLQVPTKTRLGDTEDDSVPRLSSQPLALVQVQLWESEPVRGSPFCLSSDSQIFPTLFKDHGRWE